MGREEYARAGLIGYGASREALYRHAAGMVDKLLRGVKPRHARAAQAIDVALPAPLRLRSSALIE